MSVTTRHLIGWWLSLGVVGVFVGLRLWVRSRRDNSWGKDDWLSIATMLMLIVQMIVTTLMMLEFDAPDWGTNMAAIVRFMKYSYAGSTLYLVILWMIKAQLLVFYHRLMENLGKLQLLINISAGIVFIMGLIAILINALHCQPISRQWNPDPAHQCPDQTNNPVFTFVVTVNVLTDVLIMILPFPILRNLHQPMKVKLGLVGVFLLGLVVIVVSIIRIVTILNTVDIFLISNLSYVETYVAMIISALPTLRVLFLGHRGRAYGSSYSNSGPTGTPSRLTSDKPHTLRSGQMQSRITAHSDADSFGSDIELANVDDKNVDAGGEDGAIRKTTEITIQTRPVGTSDRQSEGSGSGGFVGWEGNGSPRRNQ
ncbi:uncharacterized protein H6S33_008593 [Morchella sextelata]|uniref:uncharacterized protein n=1 Tax=Morchella sextelata TaxID=1174677 RepID=UPI001D049615|nr:uncharacterized protein H6S33_008593 [Morchella sextelata]KAH0602512.1 hypothetical protein H6S33_008593 [Morchella sextelata]